MHEALAIVSLPLLRRSRSALALRRFCVTRPFLVKKDGKSPTVNLTTNASTCIENKVASNCHHHSTCSFWKVACIDQEKVTLCTFRRLNLTTFKESTTTTNSNMSSETSLDVSETFIAFSCNFALFRRPKVFETLTADSVTCWSCFGFLLHVFSWSLQELATARLGATIAGGVGCGLVSCQHQKRTRMATLLIYHVDVPM